MEGDGQMYEVKMEFFNAQDTMITFFLEPFGTFYPMEPDATFELTLRGPIQGTVEIKYSYNSLTVYTWSGSTDATLFHNKEELFRY
jgi:hypothetical protein